MFNNKSFLKVSLKRPNGEEVSLLIQIGFATITIFTIFTLFVLCLMEKINMETFLGAIFNILR